MKNFFNEFKEFIAKGNVMAMAVGVIIGGAFATIIKSLVDDIIGPILGMILGGIDFSTIAITVGSANIMVGNFIQAVVMFILTSLVIFIMMKQFNRFKKAEEEAPAEPSDEVKLLTEIRDALNK